MINHLLVYHTIIIISHTIIIVYNKSYNNNYKFIVTVIDIFTKYAWAIPLENKSGLSITDGFKIVLSESRKPEKLWVDRGSEFYNKTFKSLLKEYGIELYST